jgi:cysteinyl-tRNA synthetase
MARYWVHNGFLQVEGEKMSKSLGNFITIRELLDKLPGDVVRHQMLMTHYRQRLDWTESNTQLARRELEDWSHLLHRHYALPNDTVPDAVIEQLGDDLNTPNALTVLREQYAAAKKGRGQEMQVFAAGCKFLGFRELGRPGLFDFGVSALNVGHQSLSKHSDAVEKLRAAIANNASDQLTSGLISSIQADGLDVQVGNDGRITLISGDRGEITAKIDKMVAARSEARARKDWSESDRIRNELVSMGVDLEDNKDGTTTWKVKR